MIPADGKHVIVCRAGFLGHKRYFFHGKIREKAITDRVETMKKAEQPQVNMPINIIRKLQTNMSVNIIGTIILVLFIFGAVVSTM